MPGVFSNPFNTNPTYTVNNSGDVIKNPAFYKTPSFWGGVVGGFTPLGSLGGRIAGTLFGKAANIGQGTNLGPIRNSMGSPSPLTMNGGGWINGSIGGFPSLPQFDMSANFTGFSNPFNIGNTLSNFVPYYIPPTVNVNDLNSNYQQMGQQGNQYYLPNVQPPSGGQQQNPSAYTQGGYGYFSDASNFTGGLNESNNGFVQLGGWGAGLGGLEPFMDLMGAGGGCFSPNTRVLGIGKFGDYKDGDVVSVATMAGVNKAATVLVHDHDGVMYEMGNGELVTATHPILDNGKWKPARRVFKSKLQYKGKVYNLHVHTEKEEERNYQLANGWWAHNKMSLAGGGGIFGGGSADPGF